MGSSKAKGKAAGAGKQTSQTLLTHEHDDTRGESSPPVASDSEELDDGGSTGRDGGLLLEKSVDHEEIASGLKLGVTKAAERLVGLAIASFADKPAWAGKGSQKGKSAFSPYSFPRGVRLTSRGRSKPGP